LIHCIRTLHRPIGQVAAEFGVSRKTACKWLAIYDADPAAPLVDRSRRPLHSPAQTDICCQQRVLQLRDRTNWGPRKIHAVLRREGVSGVPSVRTLANILRRNGRIGCGASVPAPPSCQRFVRPAPNDLWQLDHKGPIHVARSKLIPFTVIDDHSRYLLAFEPLVDRTMARCWQVLWEIFAQAGMPQQILSDNAFGTMGPEQPIGLSWFDARLIRLGITPLHGRRYHPQTQGKVERLHASAVRELIYFNARRDCAESFIRDCRRWRVLYNTQRPHEALDDQPPVSRWRPSPRQRPPTLPEAEGYYPAGATLRKVCLEGLVRYHGRRILVGRGIGGQLVRIDEDERELRIHYCWKRIRQLACEELIRDKVL
jgi:transposase InsO family protein